MEKRVWNDKQLTTKGIKILLKKVGQDLASIIARRSLNGMGKGSPWARLGLSEKTQIFDSDKRDWPFGELERCWNKICLLFLSFGLGFVGQKCQFLTRELLKRRRKKTCIALTTNGSNLELIKVKFFFSFSLLNPHLRSFVEIFRPFSMPADGKKNARREKTSFLSTPTPLSLTTPQKHLDILSLFHYLHTFLSPKWAKKRLGK